MIAYKLFRMRKDGSLGPLFINQRLKIYVDEWMEAEFHPTKGYAERMGWHTLLQPVAPHLSEKNRVWCKVEIEDFEYFTRPVNQGGRWALANRMRVLEICQ
jgi:hypothetical protein